MSEKMIYEQTKKEKRGEFYNWLFHVFERVVSGPTNQARRCCYCREAVSDYVVVSKIPFDAEVACCTKCEAALKSKGASFYEEKK
jgi:hypothetical protein